MATTVTESDVIKMISSLSNWGRWGADDQLGTLNLIDDEKRLAALQSVRLGDVVTLGAVIPVGRSRQARRTLRRWDLNTSSHSGH